MCSEGEFAGVGQKQWGGAEEEIFLNKGEWMKYGYGYSCAKSRLRVTSLTLRSYRNHSRDMRECRC